MSEHVTTLVGRGLDHFRRGEIDRATAALESALRLDAYDADANAAMGAVLAHRQYYPNAAAYYLVAERSDPTNINHPWTAGRLHLRNFTPEDAVPPLLRAREIDPRSLGVLCDIGQAYSMLGAPEQAIPYLREATALAPDDVGIMLQLATVLTDTGGFDEAGDLFRAAIEHGEDPAYALFNLALSDREDATLLPQVLAALDGHWDADPGRPERWLHHAAARLLANEGRYDESFDHLLAAKAIDPPTIDRAHMEQLHRSTRSIFDTSFFRDRRRFGDISEVPVFIIGMPRSGSTLLEAVLGGHRNVVNLGERNYVDVLAHQLWYGHGGEHEYGTRVRNLDADDVAALASDYLDRSRMLTPLGRYTTNKMLHNYLHVGLIRLVFPRARFVHCRRDPLDSCVSMFSNPIEHGHPYTNRLDDLAWQYGEYRMMMDHWATVVPESIIDVDYESFVGDLRSETERVLEFLGLPWDEECLSFADRERTVQTMSRTQVRRELYRSSIGRWRDYEARLGPLIDGLLDAGVITADDVDR